MGLNLCFAVYLAYIKVYADTLSRDVLAWMNICVYAAASVIVLVQMVSDRYFDTWHGPMLTFSVRISASLLVMTGTLLSMPFINTLPLVCAVGVLIGTFEGSALSSLQQLAAVVRADTTKYVGIGATVALLVPTVLSFLLGFNRPDVSLRVQIAYAWIPAALCFASTCIFLYTTFVRRSFDDAFDRMNTVNPDSDNSDMCNPQAHDAEVTEEDPLVTDKQMRPEGTWYDSPVTACALAIFTSSVVASFAVPLFTYLGTGGNGGDFAHILVLVRFAGEFVGRVLSISCGLQHGSREMSVAFLFLPICAQCAILPLLLFDAFGAFSLSHTTVICLVGPFFLFWSWTQAEAIALVSSAAPPNRVKGLVRGLVFLGYAAQLLSLFCTFPLLKSLGHMKVG
jgi:hypothetical protein